MSEEILKALMQLFAIIAKQDEGLSSNERDYVHLFLKQQLNESSVIEYLALFDSFIDKAKAREKEKEEKEKIKEENGTSVKDRPKLTSVKDSVKILGICKKINKTLAQKQKVVVLVRLLELINSDRKFTTQRIAIIDTAADVFNITKEKYKTIEKFVRNDDNSLFDSSEMMIINHDKSNVNENCKFIESQIDGSVLILKVSDVDLYFIRYKGSSELLLNGLLINPKRIYLFANGSVIKLPKGKPIFYSDVSAKFLDDSSFVNISFQAKNVSFKFPNKIIGLRNVNLLENSGKLLAIMGASGAGKTTLLNVLSGIDNPSEGEVLINGINIHEEKSKIKGIIGYIPQDDLLIEELSVYENLYYNTKLVFKDFTEEQIDERVLKVIANLGLSHTKDLKVGNPMNKKISGGQRKRLNIGLELIREPSILFVDEPTSGLSSRDSENVMELLRELTLKGKLIFVVIHQPSSEIYKMFDNVIILDEGGYQIYYGNPVEAVMYFKQLDNQINSNVGECPTCGNVNPETIFNIIEARIVDEYGKATIKRKVTPVEWNKEFSERIPLLEDKETHEETPEPLRIPSWFKQFRIFFSRDLFSKLSNTQYLIISLLEAPIIGFLLAFVIKYVKDPNTGIYIFRENENIMPYVFMCTIVALFLGLIVSAEEIFRDRKILKREAFLNLSRSSYLFSKIGILFILSAIQSILFVLIGNSILEIKGMYFEYWMVFFSIATLANVMGLNISSAFNSAVTIYILIPFLIIPQMVLAGAMFSFDKINRHLGGGGEKVPIIADFMPSRWAFEALLVNQFVNNDYEKLFYDLDKKRSNYNFKNVNYIPELKKIPEKYKYHIATNPNVKPISEDDLILLKNEIESELVINKKFKFSMINKINLAQFNKEVADSTLAYLNQLQDNYKIRFNNANDKQDKIITEMQDTPEKKLKYQKLIDNYKNDYLADFATNRFAPLPLVRINNHFIQKADPIYLDSKYSGILNYRSHFLAPRKYLFGNLMDTFWVNIIVIWFFTVMLYILLYYEGVKKFLDISDRIKGISLKKITLPKFKLFQFKKNKPLNQFDIL